MDNQQKINYLKRRGFNNQEVAKILKINQNEIKEQKLDIVQDSIELYSEMQKDLSKVILTEMNKKDKQDSTIILNSIRLQADLQEKKLVLNKKSSSKISKNYIYERDQEIYKLIKQGVNESEVAKKFNIGILSVRASVDRAKLDLPEHLRELSPSVISETKALPKDKRIELIEKAYTNNLGREQVRKLVNEIKNLR